MRSNTSVRIPTARRFGVVALAGVALLGACQDQTDTGFVGAPAHVVVLAGSQISGQVADTLGPFVVGVTDTAGTPVTGVPITFTITGQGTLVTTTATTDKDGSALTSVAFTHTVGSVTITATAQGVPTPAVINTSSYAGPATSLSIAGGQSQTAARNTNLPDLLTVLVADQYGNAVSSILVTFETTGAGYIANPSGRTGADGRFSSIFTLPPAAGAQTITASTTFGNGTTSTVTFTETGT